ncbi:hypothetical protein ABT299_39410 [Spirillospora sp. NPDC000708]
MTMNTNYSARSAATAAESLKRAGRWDLALDLPAARTTALRAEILTDRFFWRLDDPAEAETAVAAATYAAELPPGPEADELNRLAARTARELGLTWLAKSL